MKKYTVRFDWWECEIEIDEDIAREVIKECVEFWYDWKKRLDYNDGDYTITYIKMLAHKLIYLSIQYNTDGAIREIGDSEGWSKVDGSQGIKITSMDTWYFDDHDFEIIN